MAIVDVAIIEYLQSLVEEFGRAFLSLRGVFPAHILACLYEFEGRSVLSHHDVTDMRRESIDEMSTVESLFHHAVQQKHHLHHLAFQGEVDSVEIIVGIQHVEVFQHLFVCNIPLTERDALVEDGESVAHTSISFLSDKAESLFFVGHALIGSHVFEVRDNISHAHSLEVIHLTAREDGRQNLMLLGGGEDKDDMSRRLLKSFEESIESGSREHVYLVDDKHLVFTHLWWHSRLLHQSLDMLHAIVAGGVKFKDIQRALLSESLTALAFSASVTVRARVGAVYDLGKDTCASGLSDTSRTAEQVSMSELARCHRILQSGGECLLSHYGSEGHRAVFSC